MSNFFGLLKVLIAETRGERDPGPRLLHPTNYVVTAMTEDAHDPL
jgi:hypothetical protein